MIPTNAKKLEHNQVAEGEVTGHAHRVEGGVVYADPDDAAEARWVDAPDGAVIRHEEHKPVEIPAGQHPTYRVVEFDPFAEEIRTVAD